jgi:hypothetical protein
VKKTTENPGFQHVSTGQLPFKTEVSEITSMVHDITWHATTATARKKRQTTAALAASPGFRDGEESKLMPCWEEWTSIDHNRS